MSFQFPENNFEGAPATSPSKVPASQKKSTSSIFNLYGLFSGHRVQQSEVQKKKSISDFRWSNIFSSISNFFMGNAEGELKSPQVLHQDVLARASAESKAIIEQAIAQRAGVLKYEEKFKEASDEAIKSNVKEEIEVAIKNQVAALAKKEQWGFNSFFSVFARKPNQLFLEDRLLEKIIPALQDPSQRSSNQLLVRRYVEQRMRLLGSSATTLEEQTRIQDEIKGEVDLLIRGLAGQVLERKGNSSRYDADVLPSPEKIKKEDALLQSTLPLEMKAMGRVEKLKQKKLELEKFDQSLPQLPSAVEGAAYAKYRSLSKRRDDAVAGMKAALGRIEEMESHQLALEQVIARFQLKPTDKVDSLIAQLGNTHQKLLQYVQSMDEVRRGKKRVKPEDSIERLQQECEIDFYHEIELQQMASRVANIRETVVSLPNEKQAILLLQKNARSKKEELVAQKKQFVARQSTFLSALQQQRTSFREECDILEETMREVTSLYQQCKMRPSYSFDALKKEFHEKVSEIDECLKVGKDSQEESLDKRFQKLIQEYDDWIALLHGQQRQANQLLSSAPSFEELSSQDQIILSKVDGYSKKLGKYKEAQEQKQKELARQQELEKQKKVLAEQKRLKQQEEERRAEEGARKVLKERPGDQHLLMSQTASPASATDRQRLVTGKDSSMRVEAEEAPVNVSSNLDSTSTQSPRRLIPKGITQYTKRLTKPVVSYFRTKVAEPSLSSNVLSSSPPPVGLKRKILSAAFSGTPQPSVSVEEDEPTAIPTTQKYASEEID